MATYTLLCGDSKLSPLMLARRPKGYKATVSAIECVKPPKKVGVPALYFWAAFQKRGTAKC